MIIGVGDFLKIIKKNVKVHDEALLIKAFEFAKEAHKEQKRESGAPYIIHPIEVAILVSEYKLDVNSVIAALLHDTVEDTDTTMDDIKNNFGQEIAYLVDGLTKISDANFSSRTEKNAENFRKLILSTAKDIRILIIKLFDRLDNIRTLSGIKSKERRDLIANETLMIYVPLAERIGMYRLKLELEDLCFAELLPDERNKIIKQTKEATKNHKNIIDYILKDLITKVKFENKIDCQIFGRTKRPYSIWKKMLRKSVSFEKIFDLIAFRIIVSDIKDCYKVFGCISTNYVIVPDTFDDYISRPKANGYQSIHIIVIGPRNVKIEVQIRTEEMNYVAEYGIASHWLYKQNLKNDKYLKEYNYLKQLISNLENADYSVENFKDLTCELYEDEVFCYTPLGDIINLPIGSTGLDFAYAIHRDIGNRCSGIKINGVLSQFKTQLKSGDEVEILTSKTPQIHEEWLELVKTAKAKAEIKSFIRKSKQKEFEEIGRKEIKAILDDFGLTINDNLVEKNINKISEGKTVSEIYALIAQNRIKKKNFIKAIFPDFQKEKEEKLDENKKIKIRLQNNNTSTNQQGIEGLDKNIAYKYAKCCYPVPPEDIVGVVNSGVGITVHRKTCKTLETIEPERIIDLEWNNDNNAKYVAKVNITFDSKPGLLAKVINLCSEKKMNIIGITTVNESDLYQEIELKVEVKNADELNTFKASVRGIQGVIDLK